MGGEGSPWAPPYVMARAPSLWRRIRYKGPLSSYTLNSIPYTTAAVKDCPLQSSFRADYRYLSPWYGVQNTPVGQRVNNYCALFLNFAFRFGIRIKFCTLWYQLLPILPLDVFFKIQPKFLFPQIGLYGCQKKENFMLLPNLKMKLRKSAPMKCYLKNLAKNCWWLATSKKTDEMLFKKLAKAIFRITFLSCVFLNFAFWVGISVKNLFLVPILIFFK